MCGTSESGSLMASNVLTGRNEFEVGRRIVQLVSVEMVNMLSSIKTAAYDALHHLPVFVLSVFIPTKRAVAVACDTPLTPIGLEWVPVTNPAGIVLLANTARKHATRTGGYSTFLKLFRVAHTKNNITKGATREGGVWHACD